MPPRSRLPRSMLALVVMLSMARPAYASSVATGPAGEAQFYEKLEQAEAASGAGQLVRSGDLYTEAYDALPEAERASESGSDVVGEAVQVYRDGFFADPKNPDPLRKAKALLERHIADMSRLASTRDASQQQGQLSSIDALLAGFESEPTEPAPPVEPEPSPTPAEADDETPSTLEPTGPTRQDDAPPVTRRGPLLGLGIGGGVALVGGIALVGYGAWWRGKTAGQHEDQSAMIPSPCSPTDPAQCTLDAWKDDENGKANAVLGVGGAVAAVGLGLGIASLVMYARAKKTGRIAASPYRNRAGWGLAVHGWF